MKNFKCNSRLFFFVLTLSIYLFPGIVHAGILIDETFDYWSDRFAGPGGWNISGGRVMNRATIRSAPDDRLANYALYDTAVGGDFSIDMAVIPEETAELWDDFAIILGFQDVDNYLFVSFNENNNDTTSGIFSVVDGTVTQLADINWNVIAKYGFSQSYRVVREGNTIEVYVQDDPYLHPEVQQDLTTPLATATTSLFPSGRVGFGAKNNAIFVNRFFVTNEPLHRGPLFPEEVATYGMDDFWAFYDFFPLPGYGTWALTGNYGGYRSGVLTGPVTTGAGQIGNSNIAVDMIALDSPPLDPWDISFVVNTIQAADNPNDWDDFSLIFGFMDENNYLFVSLNETNDPSTSGIFAVVNGIGIELADIDTTIQGGVPYEVRVDRWGYDIWVYLDNVLIAQARTPLFPRGGLGIGSRNNGLSFEYFRVMAFGFDW